MAKGSLRRFDVQAKISLYVSCAAALCALGLLAMLMRNYKSEMQVIAYSGKGMFGLTVYAIAGLAILLASTGAALGAVSAGQSRNTFSKRSWVAFFLGGSTISATVIMFYMFIVCGFRI